MPGTPKTRHAVYSVVSLAHNNNNNMIVEYIHTTGSSDLGAECPTLKTENRKQPFIVLDSVALVVRNNGLSYIYCTQT